MLVKKKKKIISYIHKECDKTPRPMPAEKKLREEAIPKQEDSKKSTVSISVRRVNDKKHLRCVRIRKLQILQ